MSEPYYAPYISSDEESDDDSDSSGYTSEESLINVPGKNPPLRTGMPGPSTLPLAVPALVGTKFETQESRNTTLFMINSRDRDTLVYPQPTFFTIRLPRVMRNVKTISISQLNLLNSFFNFSTEKGNTWMYVYESGRVIADQTSGTDISNAIRVNIRNGTYNSDDLVAELSNAMNSTPIFADITLDNFISKFQNTGDFTSLFNTPGPVVYNSMTQTYERRQTINDIVARYFLVVQNIGTLTYTYNQCLIAYYYPVLKELIISQPSPLPFDSVGQTVPLGYSSWYDYILFGFQGLDDPYILKIVLDSANQSTFDSFRFKNTFNYFLVNKYNCTYNSKQGRLVITAPSLNDSIANDLSSQYSNYLNKLVVDSNFQSINDFNTKFNAITNSNGVLLEIYNYIQARFSSNFGIDFGKYTADFYANKTNEITIYNTLNKYGWTNSLTQAVSQNPISTLGLYEQVPILWSNIILPKTGWSAISSFVSTLTVPQFNNNVLNFTNSGENQLGYVDISFSILPTSYIRTTFKTQNRRNISLLTLPRYLNERGPGTEEVYNLNSTINATPLLYDTRHFIDSNTVYIRTDISGNLLFNLYNVQQDMLQSADYMRALDEWLNKMSPQILSGSFIQANNTNFGQRPPKADIALLSYRPYIFFQMNADGYLAEPSAHFRINFHVETQDGSLFPVPIRITWYKDRAAFMTDAGNDIGLTIGNENTRHYFKTEAYGTDVSGAVMVVDVNNYQKTYFMIHVENLDNIPSSIPIRVFAVLTDDYGVYTIITQDDKLDMPFQNLPLISDQFTPASDVYNDPLGSIYDNGIFKLGYDSNNVSNNLLDYIIQAGNNNYYDPNSVDDYINSVSTGLRYLFVNNSVGAGQPDPSISSPQVWSLYFGSNSSNIIRDTYNTNNNTYLSTLQVFSTNINEFILTNWSDNVTTTEHYLNPSTAPGFSIAADSVFMQCSNVPAVPTDSYTSPTFTDATGIAGVSFFLPPNQVVKMDSVVLRFTYMQPSSDENNAQFSRANSPLVLLPGGTNTGAFYRNQTTQVKTLLSDSNDWDDWYLYNRRNIKIGIFNTADVATSNISLIHISSAICTMSLSKVTQVGNYQNRPGTLHTREPDWGTYYTYKFDQASNSVWAINNPDWTTPDQTYWRSTISFADFAPTYIAGESNYVNYFLTHPDIKNYNYLPRSYGIAPSVGYAVNDPYSNLAPYTADIQNSYTAVPFYQDPATSNWIVGSFRGLSYTRTPALPSTTLIGAAPFSGPPGIFAWHNNSGTFSLYNGDQTSFQPYYWNSKILFETLDVSYNPATDLTAFGGFSGISKEYQDTMLFFYANSNANADYKDISTNTANWCWGKESNVNYIAYDDQSGYNYLSYIYNIPVRSTISEYAVHIRAYDPIPRFNTGLRIIGKNYTDFGRATLGEIGMEISSLKNYSPISDVSGSQFVRGLGDYNTVINENFTILSTIQFSHNYADSLVNFDRSFITTSTIFGAKIGYNGVSYTFKGYSDTLNQYISLYNSLQDVSFVYTNVLSTATGQLNAYILERYSNILPQNVIGRNRFTDPIPFQFLFKSRLEKPFLNYPDEWGLGYNLGFNKADTTPPRTTITSDTFIRIVQDYVYLRLNPEYNVNTMAVSGKENLSETRDSQSQDTKYFSKIILNTFGGFCRSAVQLPKNFQPPIGKYETITCQLVDKYGNQIANNDCDYDFVVEITELTNTPKDNSSLLGPLADLSVYRA